MPPITLSTRSLESPSSTQHPQIQKNIWYTCIVLKSCAPELTPVLQKPFQLSYNLCIFPSSRKLAHAFPIPKKGTNLTLQTIALFQSLLSSLRLWNPLSPDNCLPSSTLTAFFLIISMAFDKPDLLVAF